MKRMSVVGALLFLGFLLAWSPAAAQQAAPLSTSQDPAQLSTAALVPVKYSSSSGTDTILVLNAADSNATTKTVTLRFYNATCTLKADATNSLTPQDVNAMWVSDTFVGAANGVVLANVSTSVTEQFALSAVIVDFDIAFIYERQGSPLLASSSTATYGTWGGFSSADIDDWYIGGYTTLQFVCPTLALATEMNTLAGYTDSYDTTFDVYVYDYNEGNQRSIHGETCKCFTDTSDGTSLANTITAMAGNDYGTIRFELDAKVTGWRVITDGTSWTGWDGRLRHTPGQ